MEFPIKCYDVCPDCECADCIAAEVIQELKDAGKIPEQLFKKGLAIAISLFDPSMLPKMLSETLVGKPKYAVLHVFIAICKDCKKLYVKEVDLIWQELQLQMAPMKDEKIPPHFG